MSINFICIIGFFPGVSEFKGLSELKNKGRTNFRNEKNIKTSGYKNVRKKR